MRNRLDDLDQIIGGCVRNDRASQEKLYKQFYVPMYCLCRRYFSNDHSAIESVNDGMMKVFASINTYKKERGKFFNWVYTIVRNTAVDKWKAAGSSVLYGEPFIQAENFPDSTNGYNPLKVLEGKDLFKLLDHLNPATRVVCNLFYLEGYLIRDIAGRLTISEGTVKWHLNDGRKKLKSIFEKYVNACP